MDSIITQYTPISEFQNLKFKNLQDLKLKNSDTQDQINVLTIVYKTLKQLKTNYTTEQANHHKAYIEIKDFQANKFNTIFQFESKKEKTRLANKIAYNKNRHYNEKEKYAKAILSIDQQLNELRKIFLDLTDTIKEVIPEAGPACRICTDNIDSLLAAQCGHTFCIDCYKNLRKHSRNNPLCPTCRKQITRTLKIFI